MLCIGGLGGAVEKCGEILGGAVECYALVD